MSDTVEDIVVKPISSVLSDSYLRYMEMTILHRALPDIRDGLKPGQRRILYIMLRDYMASGPYSKSARIIGAVMGELHPHGDASIYETMVRMAQWWSNNVMSVDGQGNFGSVDGDRAAAMRYTEARLSKVAQLIYSDMKQLDPKRAEMVRNYDERSMEPTVLPARIPMLLINGVTGIASGVATRVPPHNPVEACNAAIAMLRNPMITNEQLFQIMPAPDFPTGGVCHDLKSIQDCMATGRGNFQLSGVCEIVPSKGRSKKDSLIVTALPYGETTAAWIQSAINVLDDQIDDIKDRSKRDVNVEFILKSGADAKLCRDILFAKTRLRITDSYNATVVSNAAPAVVGVRMMLEAFCNHRIETVYGRIEYQTNRMRDTMTRNVALWIARLDIDRVLSILRASEGTEESVSAIGALSYTLSEHPQLAEILHLYDPDAEMPEAYVVGHDIAKIIVGEKLSILTKTELNKVMGVIADLSEKIARNKDDMESPEALRNIAIEEIVEVIPLLRSERLTQIDADGFSLASVTRKAAPKAIGRSASEAEPARDVDVVVSGNDIAVYLSGKTQASEKISCTTHDQIVVFTKNLRAYTVAVGSIPISTPSDQPKFIGNYIDEMPDDDHLVTCALVDDKSDLLFVSKNGSVRRSMVSNFTSALAKGVVCYGNEEELVTILSVRNGMDVLLGASDGKALRFTINDAMRCVGSKTATGVSGMKLNDGAFIISASTMKSGSLSQPDRTRWIAGEMPEADMTATAILTLSSSGAAKCFLSHDIPEQNRGGQGIQVMTDKGDAKIIAVMKNWLTLDGADIARSDIPLHRGRSSKGVILKASFATCALHD